MSNISFYSYGDLIKKRNDFRITDRVGINRFDTPNALFYKLVFYFSDESGLLGLDGINGFDTDVLQNDIVKTKSDNGNKTYTFDPKTQNIKNTAYNFLLLNEELERAEMLKNFIILLSEINSKSPWYFQEINGIDTALERKIFSEGELKIEDKPGQFTIKCLNDAYDDRIGTLLDLYRASCFSYQNKKEIVPRNLRKFNMGILLFSAPIRGKGGKSGDKNNRIEIPNGIEDYYIPSTKLIEFRNCEFDYNSSKSPFGTLNTSEAPFSPEYTITINYDDCYESRYNEIMQEIITDFINIDINAERTNDFDDIKLHGKTIDYKRAKINTEITDTGYWVNTKGDLENLNPYEKGMEEIGMYKTREINWSFGSALLTTQMNKINEKISEAIELPSLKGGEEYKNIHDVGTVNKLGGFEYLNRMAGANGFVGSVIQQGVGLGAKTLRDEVSKLYLGNIYEMSVSNVLDITKRALSGNVAGTIGAVKNLSPKSSSKFPEPIDELYSDIQQRELGFDPTTDEIRTDPTQRELGFDPISEEIWSDPTQRTITSNEPLEKLPGYVNKRTNLLNKINKKSSIRNTL